MRAHVRTHGQRARRQSTLEISLGLVQISPDSDGCKKIGLPVVDMACRRGAGFDVHAADWINHDESTRCWRMLDTVRLYLKAGLKLLKLSQDAAL